MIGTATPTLAARRTTEGADADVVTAGARPNPNLSVSTSSLSRSLGSGSLIDKRVDTVVGLSQVFERGNKAFQRHFFESCLFVEKPAAAKKTTKPAKPTE